MVAGENQLHIGAAVKQASPQTLAILASGQYILAELYAITLVTGQSYYFTDFQVPLTSAVYRGPAAQTYLTGITITRETITQKAGIEAGNMAVTLAPQPDSPNAPILIAGYPLHQAAANGFLDGATVSMAKLFMNPPIPPAFLNPAASGGAVGWFLGTVQNVEMDRVSVTLTVDDYLAYLGNQQMPRILYSPGCFHQVYDAGCTLLKSSFTVSGTIASAGDGAHFTTNLTQADGYFNLGVLTFTSGTNNGRSGTVSLFKHASGAFSMNFPFPVAPGVGDTFSVYPGCDLQQSTCSGKFANLAHFSGQPYIPTPETILDGGTDNPPLQTPGAQAGQIIGSQPTGRNPYGPYKT
jgi:hypothetical protein